MNGLTSLWRSFPSDRLVSEDLLGKFLRHDYYGDEDTYPLDCIAGRNFFLAPHKDYIIIFKAVGKINIMTQWREIAHLQSENTSGTQYFYPYADETIERTVSQESWSSLRNGAGTGLDADKTQVYSYLECGNTSNLYTSLNRGALIFDTSSIPSDAIFELIFLAFYTTVKNISLGAFDLGVTRFYPATPGTIAVGDFSTFGEANLSKYYDYINSSGLATSTWDGFYLHTDPSYGVVINPDGYTNLMLRFSWDMEESTPPWSSGIYDSFACSSMSGGNEPYLELTWHLPFEDTETFVFGEMYHYKAVRVQNNQVSFDSRIAHHAYDGYVAECLDDTNVLDWSSTNWTTLRNGSGSEVVSSPTEIGTGQFSSSNSNEWSYLQRAILLMDTAGIPDNAVITSGFFAHFGYYRNLPAGSLSLAIIDSNPADPYNVVEGDYDGTTFTRMADDVTFANFTDWEWNFVDLTAYGKLHILKTAPTSLMMASAAEVDNSAPTWSANEEYIIASRGLYPLEYNNAENEIPPYIAVWYTIPTLQTISTSLSFTTILNAVKQGGSQFYQGVAASLGFTVSITKALIMGRTIPANATFTPLLTQVSTRLRTISANLTFSASLSKASTLGRTISANAAFTVSILRMGYKNLAANATFNTSLSRFVTAYRSISASLAFAVSILSQKTKFQTVSASLAFTASISLLKSKSVALSASLAPTVTLVRGLSLSRTLSVTETATASLSRLLSMYRGLSVIENASVSLSRSLSMLRTLSVTEQPAPTLSRLAQLNRAFSAVVSFIASLLASKVTPYPPDLLPTIYLICDTNNGASLSCDTMPSVSLECDATTKTIYLICRET
jgi:hypothetical protein